MSEKNDFKQEELIPLFVVVGPTAVGKTEISTALCNKLGGEVVSADSVQVYRHLDIGSAKPALEERQGIPHHLIDVVDPEVNFTVFDYQNMARQSIADIHKRGKLPFLTGGTGLYVKAVIDEYNFRSGKVNPLIRERLEEILELKGKEYLYRFLREIDPVTAQKVHPNDIRRIMRAFEFFYLTGEPISSQRELTEKKRSRYNLIMVGLTTKRSNLYERINKRVDLMIEQGLLEEVKGLLEKGYSSDLKSLQSLGYSHMIKYLQGKWDWDNAIINFKRDTRHYAKRQLTWFRADKRINWFEIDERRNIDPILESICSRVEGY
ncbi:MAG: tRNA (adenosine(37)-N6)-dimethylallyltransferase MiaA [Dethiobacteria bacterium]